MPFKATNNVDSNVKDALSGSDPFVIEGQAMYLSSQPGNARPVVANTSTNGDENPVNRQVPGVQVKKTFKSAKLHRQTAARSSMAPPNAQVSGGQSSTPAQHVQSTSTDAAFREINNAHPPTKVSDRFIGLPGVHQVMPKPPASVSLAMRFPSFQVPTASTCMAKCRPPLDSDENTLHNDAPVKHAQFSNTSDALPPKDLKDTRNNARDQATADARPTKRRRLLTEQEDNVPLTQVPQEKPVPTVHIQAEESQHGIDTDSASKDSAAENTDVPKETPRKATAGPTTAFQKYGAENLALFQARQAHWSTCSMEVWLAGGEEIIERFSQLLDRSVGIFEANMDIFDSIDESFKRHKKEVLDNRDQMLREAKDTIVAGCGPLLSGAPGGSESTS